MAVKVRKIERKEVEVPDLHKRIADAREKSGKPVSEVCKEVGFSRAYWYQIVNEKEDSIANETLQKIEEVLGTSFGIEFD